MVDQVVEDDRSAKTAGFGDPAATILNDHDGGRLGRLILGRHINPIVARGAGVGLAVGPSVLGHLALPHAGLARGVRAVGILGGGEQSDGEQREQRGAHMREMVSRKPYARMRVPLEHPFFHA